MEAAAPAATGVGTMEAATIQDPGDVRLVEIAVPEVAAGQVRVRIDGCGVCASNLALWKGEPWFDYPQPPGAPGHEGWGRVDAVGEGVTNLSAGDRVALLSQRAYAEYDVAAADQVVLIPPDMGDVPFPGEPLGCAINIFRRSRIEAGGTVAIVGVGFLGALLTRLAGNAGARVIAISRRPFALGVATAMGADVTVPMDDHQRVIDAVSSLTAGQFCDVVIEATGKQWPLDLAAELTRERGTLVIAGYHQDGPRQVNMQLWNWRGLDVINAHERDPAVYVEGIKLAVAAVRSGHLDPSPLYTHNFPLARLGDALNATRGRPDGFLKALVTA